MTQHQGACSRGRVRGGVPPPGTAAVSKHETKSVNTRGRAREGGHETGTVTKQTTGARGVRGRFPSRHGCCVQGSVFKNQDGLAGGTVRTDCQDGVISIHVQVVQCSPEHRLYQSTMQVL